MPQAVTYRPLASSRRLGFVAGISGTVALILLFGFIYQTAGAIVRAPSSVSTHAAANTPGKAYLSPEAAAAAAAANIPTQQTQGVTIANNGLVHIQGATVNSIQGSTVTVTSTWGSANLVWEVQVPDTVQIIGHSESKGSLSDIQVGSQITVTGMIDQSSEKPTIDAQYIRE